MQSLFEYSDALHSPYEAFFFDSCTDGFPIRPHWHYFIELLYMTEGTGRMECNGRSYVMQPDELIVFHPGAVHAIYAQSDQLPKYGIIKFDVNKLHTDNNYAPRLKTILNKAKKDERASIRFSKEELKDIPVKEIFACCRDEIAEKDYGYDIVVHERVCTLLVSLIRIWRRQGLDTDSIRAEDKAADYFREITVYIDDHAGEPLWVDELADMCNMSYSSFAKNFKRFYGRSCKEYIEFIRICKAEDLLLFTDFDLSYISQETGFSDSSHLIRTFKRWKGMTPRQYKSGHKKSNTP